MKRFASCLAVACVAVCFGGGVERVEVPKAGVQLAAECGKPAGLTKVWDFTRGTLPEGVRLRKRGRMSDNGLYTDGFADDSNQGGAELTDASTPQGAFLFEAELEVGDFAATSGVERTSRIWDDMGIHYGDKCDNTGLEIGLTQAPNGYWTPYAIFGMGGNRFRVEGVMRRLYAGARTKMSVFFGANGRVVLEFGGLLAEKTLPVGGGAAKSKRYRPVIGSRPLSNYANFDGFVRRVSVTPMKSDPAMFLTPARMAFLRGEKNAVLEMSVVNRSGGEFCDVRVVTEQFCGEGRVKTAERREGALPDGAALALPVSIETRIRPGRHVLRATLHARGAGGADITLSQLITYAVGPQIGDRMRVAIWGMPLETSPDVIRNFGFTHSYVYLGMPGAVSPDFTPKTLMNTLDRHLEKGIRTLDAFGPGFFPEGEPREKYMRWGRNGKPAKKLGSFQAEVSNPAVIERVRSVSEFAARIFADHPSFQGVLPYSERREASFPSFNTEHLRYKAETGRDVPKCVTGSGTTKFSIEEARKRFPDGVVPDDDEVYLFYRWWLKGGDGWPALHSAIADGFRKHIHRKDFVSFWDPAVRWAPAWGAGGSVDMLNQWCYAVPEPMNVAGPCEELFAMVDGRPGQKASIMTQLICYRAQMAPKEVSLPQPPEWVKNYPDAAFPTIPPDVLQEATWSMLAKPVDAIMYHGWGTIFDTHNKKRYCYTNPDSARRLTELLNGVVTPLGPVLRRLKREKPKVAVLESLATFAMGGAVTRGWKAPAITCAQRAQLDPRVVYEETIERDGFDGIKVLYAPQCSFLPKSLVGKIQGFQKAGGILVADKDCVSVLKPDVSMPIMSFDPPEADFTEQVEASERERSAADKTRKGTRLAKHVQQDAATAMRRDLAALGYVPDSDSSSPEIVVYNRRWKSTPYLFAINDNRTFGEYVGPWGLVMEKGLPYEGWVSIRDSEKRVGAVYELSRGGEVAFSREGENVKVPVKFDTNDGRMFVFLPAKIAAVEAVVPSGVVRGGEIEASLVVKGADGKPAPALLPVEIRLFDSTGREIDGGGWFCAEGGVAKVSFQTNIDDPAGAYRLVCRDRASGLTVEKKIALRRQ